MYVNGREIFWALIWREDGKWGPVELYRRCISEELT